MTQTDYYIIFNNSKMFDVTMVINEMGLLQAPVLILFVTEFYKPGFDTILVIL